MSTTSEEDSAEQPGCVSSSLQELVFEMWFSFLQIMQQRMCMAHRTHPSNFDDLMSHEPRQQQAYPACVCSSVFCTADSAFCCFILYFDLYAGVWMYLFWCIVPFFKLRSLSQYHGETLYHSRDLVSLETIERRSYSEDTSHSHVNNGSRFSLSLCLFGSFCMAEAMFWTL